MQARITAGRAAQQQLIRAMIKWMAAITIAAIMALAAAADPQQSGPSANGPVALNGSDGKSASGNSTTKNSEPVPSLGHEPIAPAKPSSGNPEPMIIVPPASIKATANASNSAKSATAPDPAAEQLWPPLNETRGLGHAGTAKSKMTAGAIGSDPSGATSTTVAKAAGSSIILGSEIGRVIAALAVVVVLVMLVRFFMKRAGGFMPGGDRPSGVVEILARYPVARGQQLVLLKLARRIVLLHQTGSAMSALSELTDPDEVASLLARLEAGSSGRSAERFQRVLQAFETEHDGVPEIHTVRNPARLTGSIGDDSEVIDLTRTRMRTLAGMLMGKAAR